ncbi:MAG: nuclear transport factor 2 family protein [Spirochaetia bacterium]|nr:nuclear transport factor 2 family protein [Spirochaetia bacterium]
MKPVEIINQFVAFFNNANVEGLINLYAEDAVNHQVVTEPLRGRDEIRKLFEQDFKRAKLERLSRFLVSSFAV